MESILSQGAAALHLKFWISGKQHTKGSRTWCCSRCWWRNLCFCSSNGDIDEHASWCCVITFYVLVQMKHAVDLLFSPFAKHLDAYLNVPKDWTWPCTLKHILCFYRRDGDRTGSHLVARLSDGIIERENATRLGDAWRGSWKINLWGESYLISVWYENLKTINFIMQKQGWCSSLPWHRK